MNQEKNHILVSNDIEEFKQLNVQNIDGDYKTSRTKSQFSTINESEPPRTLHNRLLLNISQEFENDTNNSMSIEV